MCRFLRDVIAAWAVFALFLGGIGTVFVISSADSVYAKSGHGERGGGHKGGGKGDRDKGDRSGGDRDKGERHGKKGKHGNNDRHHSVGKHHGKHDGWRGQKHGSRKDRDRRTYGRGGDTFISGFERDLRRAFGREERRTRDHSSDNRYKPQRRAKTLDRSVRPKARRDPLVASITSPYGSDKLRNLNAAKASPVAFRNASPNSNVGKISAYQASAEAYYSSQERLQRRQVRSKNLDENYDGRTSTEVLGDIADLDPNSDTFEEDFDALESELSDAQDYEQKRKSLSKSITTAKRDVGETKQQAEQDFFDASKGREVTKQTLGQLHRILGLPKPVTRPKGDATADHLASVD